MQDYKTILIIMLPLCLTVILMPLLRKICAEVFGKDVRLPLHMEEDTSTPKPRKGHIGVLIASVTAAVLGAGTVAVTLIRKKKRGS